MVGLDAVAAGWVDGDCEETHLSPGTDVEEGDGRSASAFVCLLSQQRRRERSGGEQRQTSRRVEESSGQEK